MNLKGLTSKNTQFGHEVTKIMRHDKSNVVIFSVCFSIFATVIMSFYIIDTISVGRFGGLLVAFFY